MSRVSMLCGFVILGLALMVGSGHSQDGKKDDFKYKPQLPFGFKALNLSKDQVSKIYAIHVDYQKKIVDLETKINELKEQKKLDAFKVLTKEQHTRYLKSVGVETKKTPTKDKD